MHGKGVEPLCLSAAEPKSAASASFATRAGMLLPMPCTTSFLCSSGIGAHKGQSSPAFHVRDRRPGGFNPIPLARAI